MAQDNSDLTFVRCPSCRSLIPAVSTRCRMCGASLDAEIEDNDDELEDSNGRVRQQTVSISGSSSDLMQVRDENEDDYDPLSAYIDEINLDVNQDEKTDTRIKSTDEEEELDNNIPSQNMDGNVEDGQSPAEENGNFDIENYLDQFFSSEVDASEEKTSAPIDDESKNESADSKTPEDDFFFDEEPTPDELTNSVDEQMTKPVKQLTEQPVEKKSKNIENQVKKQTANNKNEQVFQQPKKQNQKEEDEEERGERGNARVITTSSGMKKKKGSLFNKPHKTMGVKAVDDFADDTDDDFIMIGKNAPTAESVQPKADSKQVESRQREQKRENRQPVKKDEKLRDRDKNVARDNHQHNSQNNVSELKENRNTNETNHENRKENRPEKGENNRFERENVEKHFEQKTEKKSLENNEQTNKLKEKETVQQNYSQKDNFINKEKDERSLKIDRNDDTEELAKSTNRMSYGEERDDKIVVKNTYQEHKLEARKVETKVITSQRNQIGRLFGWLVSYSTSGGEGIELREGRSFVTRNTLKNNDLILDDDSISTPHAMMMISASEGFKVHDLISERGVFVRHKGEDAYHKEDELIVLENGDWIRFGDMEFLVVLIPYVGRR